MLCHVSIDTHTADRVYGLAVRFQSERSVVVIVMGSVFHGCPYRLLPCSN